MSALTANKKQEWKTEREEREWNERLLMRSSEAQSDCAERGRNAGEREAG